MATDLATLKKAYWRANLILVCSLLSVWFLFSCVLSILLVKPLNELKVGGFPLGFWIAQQGSIYVFILLILVYVIAMRRLERNYHLNPTRTA